MYHTAAEGQTYPWYKKTPHEVHPYNTLNINRNDVVCKHNVAELLISLIVCNYHRDLSDLCHNYDENNDEFARGARWLKQMQFSSGCRRPLRAVCFLKNLSSCLLPPALQLTSRFFSLPLARCFFPFSLPDPLYLLVFSFFLPSFHGLHSIPSCKNVRLFIQLLLWRLKRKNE